MNIDLSNVGKFKVFVDNYGISLMDINESLYQCFGKNGTTVLIEYNTWGKETHYKHSNGLERWTIFDDKGNKIHSYDTNGYEQWISYDINGNEIHQKKIHEYWVNDDGTYTVKPYNPSEIINYEY